MRFLWIFVLSISFGGTCKATRRNSVPTEPSTVETTIASKITNVNITRAEIINQIIVFDIEWKPRNESIYSYSIYTYISKTLNNTKNIYNHFRRFAVNHKDGTSNYRQSYSIKYFPSTTYEISVAYCNERRPEGTCDGVSQCTIHMSCKIPQTTYYHAPPIKPEIHNTSLIVCDVSMCEIHIKVMKVQTENSSLYVFQLKSEGNITMDFVKNITQMKNSSAIKILESNHDDINVMFKKTDNLCNNTTYLLLVNDYMGQLNYTTKRLFKKQIDCTPKKRMAKIPVATENNGNYYYLFIIPVVLIAIGIVAFIKRKSLYKFYKNFSTNQPVIETTIVPLVLKNTFVEKPKELFKKLKSQSQSLTPENLKLYLENNPARVITNLTNEFKNVPEDVSQQIYGESFEDQNRYNNIIPYAGSRVVLNLLENKQDSHYINASYIKGYQNDKKYIATQGPTTKTLGDFWRMIWQEKTTLIIMLTNLKENGSKKCEQYWPDKGDKLYEDYTVIYKNMYKYVEYTKREFILSHKDLQRNVTQLHFRIWPDKGIPLTPYSLVKFLKESRRHVNAGPIVVHCSAGIGRSGAFILCDYVIDMLDKSGKADFPQALFALRECRKNMVQFALQYLYCHCAVNEYLNWNSIDINVEEFKEINVSEAKMEGTLRNIKSSEYWLNILYPATIHYGYNQNKDKHRKNTQQPINSAGFISVQRYPNKDKDSYYIDAVEVLSEAGNLINTSQPLPNTLGAFWRLILEKDISVVLSLQELDVEDATSIKFWPTTEETLNPVDFITLTLIEHIREETHDSMHIKLEDSKNKEFKFIYILHFKKWKRNSLPTISEFLLYYENYAEYRRLQPILVACYDATDASSVFITFLFLLENLKRNLTIDVNTAVSTLKIYRKSLDLDMVKLKFVYDAMQVFVQDLNKDFYNDTEEIYENLKSE